MTTSRVIVESDFVQNKLLIDLQEKFGDKICIIALSKDSITNWDNHTLYIYTSIKKT